QPDSLIDKCPTSSQQAMHPNSRMKLVNKSSSSRLQSMGTVAHRSSAYYITSPQIPKAFDGYAILQLSDLHVDMSQDPMTRLMPILKEMNYDLCVLTGDYRGQTFGSYEATLVGMSQICAELKRPAYGVLGNHDTVCMLQDLEEMGIRMLINEHETIKRGHQHI